MLGEASPNSCICMCGSRGVAMAIKAKGINENSLAMHSTSPKIYHYPLPAPIFSSTLRKSQAPSWQKWGQLPPKHPLWPHHWVEVMKIITQTGIGYVGAAKVAPRIWLSPKYRHRKLLVYPYMLLFMCSGTFLGAMCM